jgi:hypothetical protein
LSRQEVAELVNEWLYRRYGTVVELDANYVGKLERGIIRWPGRSYREALRTVLRVDSDAQLGFYGRRRRPGSVDDVDRQQFLRTASAVPGVGVRTPSPGHRVIPAYGVHCGPELRVAGPVWATMLAEVDDRRRRRPGGVAVVAAPCRCRGVAGGARRGRA